jgi:hypothetical protein
MAECHNFDLIAIAAAAECYQCPLPHPLLGIIINLRFIFVFAAAVYCVYKQATLIYWHHFCPCSSSCATDSLISLVPFRPYFEHQIGVRASSFIIGEYAIPFVVVVDYAKSRAQN